MGGQVLELESERIQRLARRAGKKEGIIEGIREGKKKGSIEKSEQVYKNCRNRGMSREDSIAIADFPADYDLSKLK